MGSKPTTGGGRGSLGDRGSITTPTFSLSLVVGVPDVMVVGVEDDVVCLDGGGSDSSGGGGGGVVANNRTYSANELIPT